VIPWWLFALYERQRVEAWRRQQAQKLETK